MFWSIFVISARFVQLKTHTVPSQLTIVAVFSKVVRRSGPVFNNVNYAKYENGLERPGKQSPSNFHLPTYFEYSISESSSTK